MELPQWRRYDCARYSVVELRSGAGSCVCVAGTLSTTTSAAGGVAMTPTKLGGTETESVYSLAAPVPGVAAVATSTPARRGAT